MYIRTYIHTYMHTYIDAHCKTTQLNYGHSSLRVYLTGEYIYTQQKTLFPFLDMPVNCSDAII